MYIPISSYRVYHKRSLFMLYVTVDDIPVIDIYVMAHTCRWTMVQNNVCKFTHTRYRWWKCSWTDRAAAIFTRLSYRQSVPVTSKFTHIIYIYATGGGSAPGPIERPPYIRGCPTGNQCWSHPE